MWKKISQLFIFWIKTRKTYWFDCWLKNLIILMIVWLSINIFIIVFSKRVFTMFSVKFHFINLFKYIMCSIQKLNISVFCQLRLKSDCWLKWKLASSILLFFFRYHCRLCIWLAMPSGFWSRCGFLCPLPLIWQWWSRGELSMGRLKRGFLLPVGVFMIIDQQRGWCNSVSNLFVVVW